MGSQRRKQYSKKTDAEEQKRGEQRGLDTPLVHALTYECSIGFIKISLYAVNAQTLRLRSTAARLELKRIDGGLHKRWSMWFNLIIRVKPYQILDMVEL
jgi:hypothetical protein